MEGCHVIDGLISLFPGSQQDAQSFLNSPDADRIIKRLCAMEKEPIHLTHFNQLLHLVHEAGVTAGFFRYYFLHEPMQHPYPVGIVTVPKPRLDTQGISSLEQLLWGIRRFCIDALLYWGNLRSAYRDLRLLNFEDIQTTFNKKRFPSADLKSRGPVLPFNKIHIDDRYLISEVAYKAFSPNTGKSVFSEELLVDAYRKSGGKPVTIASLFDKNSAIAKDDPQSQMLLQFSTEEIAGEIVESESDIKLKIGPITERFKKARELALENTRLFLSIVNELDVYVATSMRSRSDFRNMAKDCEFIFHQTELDKFKLRYFDPTISAADSHEDKGLIECLMVKCCKALLYFAGNKDSFGKDAEVAMALSLGRPAIILCPDDAEGKQRAKFFRDIHPLSRMIQFETGVACGAIVTQDTTVVARLLARIFDDQMEYDLECDGNGYFRLKERLTQSVVRLQTADRLIRESFWNYYHGIP